jgi:hypothetical protein
VAKRPPPVHDEAHMIRAHVILPLLVTCPFHP